MLRRMLIVAAVLQTSLLLAAPTTQPYTATTFDDACKQLRERGFPATMEDLQRQAIPDEKNGAVYLTRAAEALVPETSGPRNSGLEYGPTLPYPREWSNQAEAAEKANAVALDLVRKARNCGDHISWDMLPQAAQADRMQQVIKGLSAFRALASLVTDEALLEHFRGDDAAAFETGRDAVYLVQASSRRPFLVSALVTAGVRAMVAENYRLMAVNLQIADDPGHKGAHRKVVQETIAWLFDDAQIREGMHGTFLQERVYALADAKSNGYAAAPAWKADLPSILELYDVLARQTDVPPWKQIKVAHPPKGPHKSLYDNITRSADVWRQGMWRIRLEQCLSAVSLATALYHQDKGTYPKGLEDLVPDYLPSLPIDPYSRSGEPLMYNVLADGKRPRLGSVGPDGVGAQLEDEAPPQARYDLHLVPPGQSPDDIWIDLAAWPSHGGK